jgi:hypothetical protein
LFGLSQSCLRSLQPDGLAHAIIALSPETNQNCDKNKFNSVQVSFFTGFTEQKYSNVEACAPSLHRMSRVAILSVFFALCGTNRADPIRYLSLMYHSAWHPEKRNWTSGKKG